MFTDDGNSHDFTDWCEKEFFGSSLAYLASIDKVEDRGLTIYGRFHSDQWGDFKTHLKFYVDNGKIADGSGPSRLLKSRPKLCMHFFRSNQDRDNEHD